jgi:O-succinylhomoserine sulfhydrylase
MTDKEDFIRHTGTDTRAVRGGQRRTMEREHSEALFLTSSYVFESAADMAATFSGEVEGNVYSRYTNPTVRNFEERLALMEGGDAAVATSSGMAAILSVCMSLLQAGEHIVASRSIFGSTTNLFTKYLEKFGVPVTFVALTDLSAWEAAIQPNTKLFFLESPSNPLAEVADISAVSAVARQHGIVSVVDNCFCTPALQKPLALGADLVVHSATKYIDGQGRAMGGAVVGSFAHIADIVGFLRTAGPTMSPFNAWVFLKGLETLSLRMRAHSSSAQYLAEWLEQHPKVEHVYYTGLKSHPQHKLAAQQMRGFGGVVGFEVTGGQDAAWRLIDATQLLSITANLGDAKTTITHPATTTHGKLSDQQRDDAGIKPGLVRIAVGLEDVDDIQADLIRGLEAV